MQQLCACHTSSFEAAIQVARSILNHPEAQALLTVNAMNAFNSPNRKVALKTVIKLCPPFSKALLNTHRSDIDLYINGETLSSLEGTIQGGSLAMAMYVIATVSLIKKFQMKV